MKVLFLFSLVGGIAALSLAAILLIRRCMVVCTVENVSMSPTLEPGDRVLVVRDWPDRWLRRGNIVLVWLSHTPSDRLTLAEIKPHIKRAVGIGGDTFTLPLDEDGENDQNERGTHQSQKTWHVPHGHIFVCGDNRPASLDSRIWGPLPLHSVLGVVLMKLPRRAYTVPPSQSVLPEEIPACGLSVGDTAPPFVAQTLSKETVTLATYSGQAVVFIFVKPSSLYEATVLRCTAIAPIAAKADVSMVFVGDAEAELMHSFVQKLDIHLPILAAPHKNNPFLHDYNISGTPAYCFINQQGRIRSSGFLNIGRDGWSSLVASWTEGKAS